MILSKEQVLNIKTEGNGIEKEMTRNNKFGNMESTISNSDNRNSYLEDEVHVDENINRNNKGTSINRIVNFVAFEFDFVNEFCIYSLRDGLWDFFLTR